MEGLIIQKYRDGAGVRNLHKEFGISRWYIKKILKSYGIKIRSSVEHKIMHRKGMVVGCFTCGNDVYKNETDVRENKGMGFFCCRECYYEFLKTASLGSKNHQWKGNRDLRDFVRHCPSHRDWVKAVFERDDYTCQMCYRRGVYLESHHLIPFKYIFEDFLNKYPDLSVQDDLEELCRLLSKYESFFDINNGQTLCKKCHHFVTWKN